MRTTVINILVGGVAILCGIPCMHLHAETPSFEKGAFDELEEFKREAFEELDDFREEINQEMSEFLGRPWKLCDLNEKIKLKEEPSPDPVVIDLDKVPKPKPKPVVIKEVVTPPSPSPQPNPVSPIKEVLSYEKRLSLTFYGTDFKVRDPQISQLRLKCRSNSEIANAWTYLSSDRTNNLILDCLDVREKYQLCDWAYLQLLQQVSWMLSGGDSNITALITGYLYCQSGYQMRYALEQTGELHMLYATNSIVYNTNNFIVGGQRYYSLTPLKSQSAYICEFSFPKEKKLDFSIHRQMQLDCKPSSVRRVETKYVPDLVAEVSINQNLIDFYNDYPEATLDESPYTRWAMYANVPATKEIVRDLYPVAKKAIQGKSQKDAANILLHLAQSFPYGYDDKIWGKDRAFFMDESWFYPLSDCEDHAINFSRLVRDLLNLDVALVYYPGHLAAAVAFTDPEIEGDYVIHKNRKYTICDPTYFYATIGITMPGHDNKSAVFVDLRK